MKSEHRHELETNTLSRELATWIERIKPHTTTIFVGIAILAGLYLAAVWWSAERAELDRRFWEEFQVKLTDSDPEYEEIRRLAESDDYAGAAGQEWAYLAWADRQLRLASMEYLQSRETARERLTSIAGVFDTLASGAANEQIANRARYGLARVYEMQNKIDDALRQYNMVRGPLAEHASQRAEQLQDEASREDVAWLATADIPRPPANPSNPTLGQAPDFNVIPPTGSSGAGPRLDTMRSLDDILGDLAAEEAQSERYDEQAEPSEDATENDSPPSDSAGDEAAEDDDAPEDADDAAPTNSDAAESSAEQPGTTPDSDAAEEPTPDVVEELDADAAADPDDSAANDSDAAAADSSDENQ